MYYFYLINNLFNGIATIKSLFSIVTDAKINRDNILCTDNIQLLPSRWNVGSQISTLHKFGSFPREKWKQLFDGLNHQT